MAISTSPWTPEAEGEALAQLTLCMIVRDEEEMLPDCLASARRAVDRMVIVDTGSTDGTRDVIQRFGAELVEYPWNDDFAAARNAGLARVDSGFVLILDADERLSARGARVLRKLARRGEIDLGLLPLHDAATLDARPDDVLSGRGRRGEPILLPRFLRRTPDLRYEGIVHESVAAWAAGRCAEVIDAAIVHYGAAQELRTERGKDERNLRLLERRCALEPGNPIPHAYRAAELRRAGAWEPALEAAREAWSTWQESTRRGEAHDGVLPASLLGHLAIQLGHLDEVSAVMAEALVHEEHPNLHLLAGVAHERRVLSHGGDAEFLSRAAHHYERCLELGDRRFASEVMDGATSWQAATRLGTVWLQAGDPERAHAAFERALAERGDLREAKLGLAEATLEKGEAEAALARLEPLVAEPDPDAWLLAARAARKLGSLPDARLMAERARAARDGQPFLAPHRERALTTLEREISHAEATVAAPATQETCVFAWPCYEEGEDLDALMGGFGKLLADRPGLVLCLRHDREVDGDIAGVEARLERAFADHLGEGCNLQVVLMDQALEPGRPLAELAAPRDIVLELPHTRGVRRRFLEDLGARRVDSPAALALALGNPA